MNTAIPSVPAVSWVVRGLFPLLLAWPLLAAGAGAAADDGVPPSGGSAVQRTAPVELDGKLIVRLRGIASYTAEERADAVAQRIRDFARQRDLPVSLLQTVESPRGTDIAVGATTLVTITDADAALEDISRPLLASAVAEILALSVTTWREERSPERLLRHAGYALAATLLLAAALWLVIMGFHKLRALARLRASGRLKSLQFGKFELVNVARLRQLMGGALRLLSWLTALTVVYLYLQFVLPLFPWTRPIGVRLLDLVVTPLATLGLSFIDALPNLAFLVVLGLVVRYVLKLVRLFFLAIEHGTLRFETFDPDWALPTYKVLRIFIVAFAVVIAYPYIPGSDSAAFKGVSVLLGVIFSLGSSSVIGNLIAGYTMTYRRAFRRGDRISVGDFTGEVIDSRVMVTTLRTPRNELVVVPNSEILGKPVVNYSTLAKDRGLLLHTTVGIGYETPWRQVEAMLLIAAGRTAGVETDPAPFVLQRALGDFCVTYELNVVTRDASSMLAKYSALHANILDVFNEYGVQIMTPNYVRDPEEPKLVRAADWYAAPATAPADLPPRGTGAS